MWSRALQVIAGAVTIGLSFVAIAYPGLALEAAAVVSVVMLIAGVELIVGGISKYRSQRAAQIGIGVLVIFLCKLSANYAGSCVRNSSRPRELLPSIRNCSSTAVSSA